MLAPCPLCGLSLVVDPDAPPVAWDRRTGEPVQICRRCQDDVGFVLRAEAAAGRSGRTEAPTGPRSAAECGR